MGSSKSFKFYLRLVPTYHPRWFWSCRNFAEVLGTAPPQANNSTTETRGWEFVINWKDKMGNLAGKALNYEVGINYSDFISYIVDYDHTGTGKMTEYTPGMMIGQNYHYVSKGIAQNSDDVYANVVKDNNWYYAGDLMLADLNGDGFVGSNGKWQSMGDVKRTDLVTHVELTGLTLAWSGIILMYR